MATNEIPIKVSADTRQAERALNDLEQSLKDIEKVGSAAAKALGVITAAGAGLAFALKSTVDQIGDLADLGKILGITAQSLNTLQQSARLAGVGAEELNMTLFKLRANLGDALVKGTGPAIDALNRLGVNIEQISSLPADQQLKKITSELLKIQDPAERAALSMDLLGKQGPRMLEVAANVERLAIQAERLGIALTDQEVKVLEEAGDALDELAFIARDTLNKAMAQLAPYLIALVESFKEAVIEGGGLGRIVTENIIPAIKIATQAAVIFASVLVASKIAAGIIAATSAMISMYQAIKVATTAAGVLNAVLGKNPIIKIVGALAAVAGAAVALGKVDSAFDELDKKAKAVMDDINQKVIDQKTNTDQVQQAVKRLTEEQKKLLAEVEKTIVGYERTARAAVERLSMGESEAEVQKRISEITDKLAEKGLQITDQMRERIRLATEEEQVAKRLFDRRKEIENLQRSAQVAGGANAELLGIQEQIKKATEDRVMAERTANETILNEAIKQEDTLKALYKDRVIQIAQGATEAGRVQSEYYSKVNQLENLRQELIKAGVDQESELFRQLSEEKGRLAEEYNKKVEQLELQRIEKTLMAQRGALAEQLSDQDRALLQRIGAEERQRAIVQERINFEKKSELEKTQFALGNLQTVFGALAAQNKKAFEANKALAIASALVNTYQGATKALATYPWPFGLIAAAAAVASGLAQVAAIRSQQYSGRALGGPVMGGTGYIVGENGPELFTPNTTGSITRNDQLGSSQPVNVNFTIVANDTQGFDQLLTSRKGVITQIISDAMLERGQRSMV